MPKLVGNIQFTGNMGNMTAYKMRGHDDVIVRRTSAPTKFQLKHSPGFANVRRNNMEWKSSTQAAAQLRRAMNRTIHLSDNNISAPLNGLTLKICKLSTIGTWGTRPVLYSVHKDKLAGYNFNLKNMFDSIVRSAVNCTISRETNTATIQLPSLEPGVQLKFPWKQPVYRFVLQLGAVSDCMYDEKRKDYKVITNTEFIHAYAETEWLAVKKCFEGRTFELVFPKPELIDDSKTFILSIGIEMGNMEVPGEIASVKYAGAGKILAVG